MGSPLSCANATILELSAVQTPLFGIIKILLRFFFFCCFLDGKTTLKVPFRRSNSVLSRVSCVPLFSADDTDLDMVRKTQLKNTNLSNIENRMLFCSKFFFIINKTNNKNEIENNESSVMRVVDFWPKNSSGF